MRVSVVIPTLRRPDDLIRCLTALSTQSTPAEEVVVIVRSDDHVTARRIAEWRRMNSLPGLQIVSTDEPGVVSAYNLGIRLTGGDIVCFTDDDAAPHRDWVERVRRTFSENAGIGGLGGRDVIHVDGQPVTGNKRAVGTINWYGAMEGNHHIGTGAIRDIQILKGVNMCWRRVAIEGLRFDERLRGAGAQANCEVPFSLAVIGRGWRLIYDPQLVVDHFHAPRFDDDHRNRFNELAFFNASFNFSLAMFESLSPLRRWFYCRYAVWVGTYDRPGLARALKLVAEGESVRRAVQKWRVSRRAMVAARSAAGVTVGAMPFPGPGAVP